MNPSWCLTRILRSSAPTNLFIRTFQSQKKNRSVKTSSNYKTTNGIFRNCTTIFPGYKQKRKCSLNGKSLIHFQKQEGVRYVSMPNPFKEKMSVIGYCW